ncbi:hypothetical protein ACHAW6_002000 [Cyclotella cf. meneghiniana]
MEWITGYCQVTDRWFGRVPFPIDSPHALRIASSYLRVPLGFICGYPLPTGELYSGSMFHPSAANDTLQGQAIQKINNLWGSDHHSRRGSRRAGFEEDRKSIGIPVCKKKYRPFEFHLKRNRNGLVNIKVERMYGCCSHSNIRKRVIERHGERKGWEPFGQWSLAKAKTAAKKEAARLNGEKSGESSPSTDSSGYDSSQSSSSFDLTSSSLFSCSRKDERQQQSWQTLCHDGMCNWKVRGKLDDISLEIEKERLI